MAVYAQGQASGDSREVMRGFPELWGMMGKLRMDQSELELW